MICRLQNYRYTHLQGDEDSTYALHKYGTLLPLPALVSTYYKLRKEANLVFKATVTDTHCSGFHNCFSSGTSNARQCLKLICGSSVYIQVFLTVSHYISLFYSPHTTNT